MSGIGARQQGHHIGARRMGDPGLVACNLPCVAVLGRARAQRAKVRSRVRLGEHRRRQDFAGRDAGEVLLLLCARAAIEQKLGRDFRARAQ
jgi:hypothetical protein